MQCVGFQANPYSWMKSADLFCLPSKYEGLPNVLIEAMACGVPAISTDCPHGPNEILCGGELGEIVPVGDSAALAQAIAGVISNPVDARQRASLALAMSRPAATAMTQTQRFTRSQPSTATNSITTATASSMMSMLYTRVCLAAYPTYS